KAPDTVAAGKVRLDMAARKAYLREKPVELWAKEFDLLALLVAQAGRVLTREFLLQYVWGYEAGSQPETKVVDVTVSHLRAKLGSYGERIASVRGFGYRFDPD
ncbi:MAG TPA: winged helix-turn-helix domain-containing protein, partial [Elusimicrobiota bacterium]|nr:winged helix-turn-helix domain-containing protein [Elusimicrobiota bacterium]